MSDPATPDARGAWEQLGPDRTVYAGFMRVVLRRLRLPDGREVEWDLLDMAPSVTVLPLTPDGRVVCVSQYRPGPNRYVVSLPGGLVDAGEEPEAAGLLAASLGYSRMFKDDLVQLEHAMGLYDALYRWCRDATEETHNWPSAKNQV